MVCGEMYQVDDDLLAVVSNLLIKVSLHSNLLERKNIIDSSSEESNGGGTVGD